MLERLALEPESILDHNPSFVVVKCANGNAQKLVVKYNHSGTADATRRLRNEALLTQRYSAARPLRFLDYVCHGDDYLVTKYESAPTLAQSDLANGTIVELLATALANFQSDAPDVAALGVKDREPLWWYYTKVSLKHVVHLWPVHLDVRTGARAMRLILGGMRAVHATGTVCHADFLPTNLLYDRKTRSVIFLDLEGFMTRNHPLFDVLAFLTIDERPLADWDWQRHFFAHYIARCGHRFRLDTRSDEFAAAYRAILTFYLVYRYNESRMLETNADYFDGLSRWTYLRRKLMDLYRRRRIRESARVSDLVGIRKDNLLRTLSDAAFDEHLGRMLAAASGLSSRRHYER